MYHNDKVENQFLYRTIGDPCGLLYMYKIDVIGVACCGKLDMGSGKDVWKKLRKIEIGPSISTPGARMGVRTSSSDNLTTLIICNVVSQFRRPCASRDPNSCNSVMFLSYFFIFQFFFYRTPVCSALYYYKYYVS